MQPKDSRVPLGSPQELIPSKKRVLLKAKPPRGKIPALWDRVSIVSHVKSRGNWKEWNDPRILEFQKASIPLQYVEHAQFLSDEEGSLTVIPPRVKPEVVASLEGEDHDEFTSQIIEELTTRKAEARNHIRQIEAQQSALDSQSEVDIEPQRRLLKWLVRVLSAIAALFYVSEGAIISLPLLDRCGIDTSQMMTELSRNFPVVAVVTLIGYAITAVLFVATHFLIQWSIDAGQRLKDPLEIFLDSKGWGILGLSLGMGFLCYVIAGLRESASMAAMTLNTATSSNLSGPAMEPASHFWLFFCLTLFVPFIVALIIRYAFKIWKALHTVSPRGRLEQRRIEKEREYDEADQKLAEAYQAKEARKNARDTQIRIEWNYANELKNLIIAQIARDHKIFSSKAKKYPREGLLKPLFTACLAAILALGFSTPVTAENLDTPRHIAVVCAGACDPGDRLQAYDEWLDKGQVLYRSGSRFELYDETGHPLFSDQVPSRWSAPVMSAKRAFVERVRNAAGADIGLLRQEALNGTSTTSLPTTATPGAYSVFVTSDHGPPVRVWPTAATAAPSHQVVLCDLSGSMHGAYEENEFLDLYDTWLSSAQGAPGITFSIYAVGESYTTAQRLFSIAVPDQVPGQRVAALRAKRRSLQDVIQTSLVEHRGSALAEAISVAVLSLRHQTGPKQLLIYSDLRQVTPGQWNFERQIPPTDDFIAWLKSEALGVDLHGVDVLVNDFHIRPAYSSAVITPKERNQLLDLWAKTLAAMGSRPFFSD